jgi:hyperosmotically inducible periplasmic protein
MVSAFAMLMGLSDSQTPAGKTAGDVVDDFAITTKAKAQLLADNELSSFATTMKTFEEKVTLTGSVENHYQKAPAEEIVQLVHGLSTAPFISLFTKRENK